MVYYKSQDILFFDVWTVSSPFQCINLGRVDAVLVEDGHKMENEH